jgi:molecular chaperone GrpE
MVDRDKEAPGGDVVPVDELSERPAGTGAGTGAGGEARADETEQLKNRLAYLAAEFDNFRKRVAREREAQAAFGNEQLLRAVLPFLDNLERAMEQEGATAETLLSGVRMTHDQFLAELRKFGLEQISAAGRSFDPGRHEAIACVRWEGKPAGTVISETRKGYLLHDRLLRPAQVTVVAPSGGDGPEEEPASSGN